MPQIPDVVILSGGLGSRLRGVAGDVPKPMAQIGGRPFIELLLKQLKRHGFSTVILSVGYKYNTIRDYFGERAFALKLLYSVESSPLGTGGALRQAVEQVTTDAVLIMNGDSYTDLDLGGFVQAHANSGADVTIAVVPGSRNDAGSVVLQQDGKIVAFAEKLMVADSFYLSAGIYMLNRNLFSDIPPAVKISLEEQLFPQWLADAKNIKGFVFQGQCIDIGTPERYRIAQELFKNGAVSDHS
jgi:D-glycero-alpha-D-manno-heptose 1-phosphate guanylyltransferase